MHNKKRPILEIKEGDTRPTLEDELIDTDRNAVDLTDADHVRFYMEHKRSGDLIVNSEASIADTSTGEVSYQFADGETSRSGRHWAEWVVTFTDGTVRSFPPGRNLAIDIAEPVARDADVAGLDDPDLSVQRVFTDELHANAAESIALKDDLDAEGSRSVTGLREPSDDTDAARKSEIDSLDDAKADLNSDGVVYASQIPDLAISETHPVADETERLSLDVEEGDVAIQEDTSTTYIFTGGDPSLNENWSQFEFDPPVDSVHGRTGDVSAQEGDYSYGQISGTHGNNAHSTNYSEQGHDHDGETLSPSATNVEEIVLEDTADQ